MTLGQHLAALDAALDRVGDRGALAVIRGYPGMGKTTLLNRLRRTWLARGVDVRTAFTGEWASGRPVALLLDDAESAATALAASRAGWRVVATCVEPGTLTELADHLVELRSLSETETAELVAGLAGARVDFAVVPALRTALGTLAGNPGTIVSTMDSLRAAGRLTEVHGVLYLRDHTRPIPLPADHKLVGEVTPLGAQLLAMVATAERFDVNDLNVFAAATGQPLADCGRTTDDLVTIGALAGGCSGRLYLPCPALGATVLASLGEDAVRELHRGFAEHLLRTNVPVNAAILAAHVNLAGQALPVTPSVVDRLVDRTDWAEVLKPELTARRYQAAVLHLGPDHPQAARIMSVLPRLLARIGRYDWLAEFVNDFTPGWAAAHDTELSFVAALAALHTGQPVPKRIRVLLTGRPLELCDRWFGGTTVSAAEIPQVFTDACGAWGPVPAREADRDGLLAAYSSFDLVTVFQNLYGESYGVPQDGPLAAYHQLLRDYTRGDWEAALSAAIDLDLTGPETPVHALARLLAAEMCSNRGELDQASCWLAAGSTLVAARGWVECGLLARMGKKHDSVVVGLKAYEEAVRLGDDVGMDLLILRLCVSALEGRRPELARRMLAAAVERHTKRGSRASHATLMLTRAMVEGDTDAAMAMVNAARQMADNRLARLHANVIAASLVEDPGPLFEESLEIVTRMGADAHAQIIKELMRRRRRAPARAKAVLSETELRIIQLVTEGRTNRQIAAAIRVSEKTVENNLTRVFAKTGCRTRVDLAAANLEGRLAAARPAVG
jgi:DNA-binding NarL/FixJ family response regulator